MLLLFLQAYVEVCTALFGLSLPSPPHRPRILGEIYTYLPLTSSNRTNLLATPPFSVENPDFGISVGRGAFSFAPGAWSAFCTRVRLNEFGKEDGEWFVADFECC